MFRIFFILSAFIVILFAQNEQNQAFSTQNLQQNTENLHSQNEQSSKNTENSSNSQQNSAQNAKNSAPQAPQNQTQNLENSAQISQNSQQNLPKNAENSRPQNEQSPKNAENSRPQNEQSPINTENSANSHPKPTPEPRVYDFAEIAALEYRGESRTLNILRLKTHDINYILPFSYAFGSRGTNAAKRAETKFQLSVKKAFFEDVLGLGESLYFGYTQTAWWQIFAESAPFRELNYAPEVFLSFPLSGFGVFKNLSLGFMHQSNGKDGASSRSWNRAYLSTLLHAGRFVLVSRAWFIINEPSLSENRDIARYLGHFDAKFAYLGRDTFAYILVRNNLNFKHNRGAVELNAGFDLFDNGIFWYVQYFNGYGESLIDYNRHANRLSVGFLVAY